MRYITLAFAFLLMIAFGSTAQAQTTNMPPGANCNADSNGGLSHDACVVMSNKGAGASDPSGEKTVGACKVLESTEALQSLGFASYGDCVSRGATVFGPTPSSFAVFALLLTGWVAVQWRSRRKRELLCQA
jgi:hypothetical protein